MIERRAVLRIGCGSKRKMARPKGLSSRFALGHLRFASIPNLQVRSFSALHKPEGPQRDEPLWFVARPKGFEPLTPRFVVWCSIQLSYGRAGAGIGQKAAAGGT